MTTKSIGLSDKFTEDYSDPAREINVVIHSKFIMVQELCKKNVILQPNTKPTGEFAKRVREMSFQLFVCRGIDR